MFLKKKATMPNRIWLNLMMMIISKMIVRRESHETNKTQDVISRQKSNALA